MAKKLTPAKAKEILHDGTVHGKPITEKQRRFFGVMSNAQAGDTLYVSNPNDRRLKSYQDSATLYNSYLQNLERLKQFGQPVQTVSKLDPSLEYDAGLNKLFYSNKQIREAAKKSDRILTPYMYDQWNAQDYFTQGADRYDKATNRFYKTPQQNKFVTYEASHPKIKPIGTDEVYLPPVTEEGYAEKIRKKKTVVSDQSGKTISDTGYQEDSRDINFGSRTLNNQPLRTQKYPQPVQPVVYDPNLKDQKIDTDKSFDLKKAAPELLKAINEFKNLKGDNPQKVNEIITILEKYKVPKINRSDGAVEYNVHNIDTGSKKPAPKPRLVKELIKKPTNILGKVPYDLESPSVEATIPLTAKSLQQPTTPYSFTFRDETNPARQSTQYFPDLESWKQFTEQNPYISRDVSGDNKSAQAAGYRQFAGGGTVADNGVGIVYPQAYPTTSAGPNYVGEGYFTKGRDYSPAWGGSFQRGGAVRKNNGNLPPVTVTAKVKTKIPQAARDNTAAPFQLPNGRFANTFNLGLSKGGLRKMQAPGQYDFPFTANQIDAVTDYAQFIPGRVGTAAEVAGMAIDAYQAAKAFENKKYEEAAINAASAAWPFLKESDYKTMGNILETGYDTYQALDDWEKSRNKKKAGGLIKRADGSYSRHGLWDSIRENKGSGKKPTKEMLKQEKKIKAKEMEMGGYLPTAQVGKTMPPAAASDATRVVLPEIVQKFDRAPLSGEEQQQLASAKKAEKQRVASRKAAVAAIDNKEPFKLPTGETKPYESMTGREKSYVEGLALEQRGRFNENEESLLDDLNPLNIVGTMAGALGKAPYEAKMSNSNLPYLSALATPLVTGALGQVGAENTGQFLNNTFNPLAGVVPNDYSLHLKPLGSLREMAHDYFNLGSQALSSKEAEIIEDLVARGDIDPEDFIRPATPTETFNWGTPEWNVNNQANTASWQQARNAQSTPPIVRPAEMQRSMATAPSIQPFSTGNRPVKNVSGMTKEAVLQELPEEERAAFSQMSDDDFKQTAFTPNKKIVKVASNDVANYFSGNEAIQPMDKQEFIDTFNQNLGLLNDIIRRRNKTGIDYTVTNLTPDGGLIFHTPRQEVLNTEFKSESYLKKLKELEANPEAFLKKEHNFRENPEGKWVIDLPENPEIQSEFDTKEEGLNYFLDRARRKNYKEIEGSNEWGVKINPGQWRGEVQEVLNPDYYKRIPGLEMSNTVPGVFADRVPRKGTGAYEAINEYLKRLDLGRVKPGFNTQTKSSLGAWENFVKSGRAVGHYSQPIFGGKVVHGIMKKMGGALSGASGMMYARTGPTYMDKKQAGGMLYYEHGEDWRPRSMQSGGSPDRMSFDEWYKTVPSDKNDTSSYNLRRVYELAPQQQLDAFVKNPKAHLYSAYENPETGIWEFMKSKQHPTVQKEIDWFNSNDSEAIQFRKKYKLDTSGDYYKYVPKKQTKTFAEGGNVPVSSQGLYEYPQQTVDVPTSNGMITMQGIDYPVLGTDENGMQQVMQPGGEYQYSGQMVREVPLDDSVEGNPGKQVNEALAATSRYDNNTTYRDLVKNAAKAVGVDPRMLWSSSFVEGMGLLVTHPDQVSSAYNKAFDKDPKLQDYQIDGFYNYGLDNFGDVFPTLVKKGYLPKDFDYHTFKALNEQKKSVNTAAFKNNYDAIRAKAAYLRHEGDRVYQYADKLKLKLSPEEQSFFTMAAYNGGLGSAQAMLDALKKSGLSAEEYIKRGKTPKGQVYKNVKPRYDMMAELLDVFEAGGTVTTQQDKGQLKKLDQLTNFTNYNYYE